LMATCQTAPVLGHFLVGDRDSVRPGIIRAAARSVV
jgi:hypothetical protein